MSSNQLTGLEIAVIGMAGRFPGAKNIREFWENLKNGVESIAFFSRQELEESGISTELLNSPNYVKASAFLENCEYFDADFFGYTPREAELMDPQMRIFHECAWHALEDAGYCPQAYEGLIGLYAGASSSFSWEILAQLSGKANEIGQYAADNLVNKEFLCLRISYKLNLKGPAVLVQSTCSTSLVAIHVACQAILNGECDMALAGGVTAALMKKKGYLYQDGMIFSPDGHCRAFDARAKGVIGGNGVGIVVLKRYEEAAAHGDHIYALVKGSAVNNDGTRKIGFTAPSIEGEADAIMTALEMAEVEPESIGYIETHGTGTVLGDPVEWEGLVQAFATGKKGFCAIGSLKTNMGHLDCAAGAAGFIKAVLALKHRLIPPSLHFNSPNPKIDIDNSPFYVNTGLKEWERRGYPLRAGVSSFGIGGTNAHVILEEAPGAQGAGRKAQSEGSQGRDGVSPPEKSQEYQLILLSAKTQTALDKMTENLAEYFKKNLLNHGNHENPINPGQTLADTAYTLQMGRQVFPHRRFLVASSVDEAIAALSSPEPGNLHSFHLQETDENRPVIFMFPGQGAQYVNMGLDIYKKESIFQKEMDRCFKILNNLMGTDIKGILYPASRHYRPNRPNESYNSYSSHINQTEIAQPVLFIIEYALAKLLIAWGIEPYAMIGHSIGEYAAACLSGVFSLQDALKLVVLRGRLMQRMSRGSMLSVSIPEEELLPLLKSNKGLSLAAVNSTYLCTVSGPQPTVETFEKKLKEKGYQCQRLHTSHAFHSQMMEPIVTEFEAEVRNVELKPPELPYISNVTGEWIAVDEAVDPGYWAAHILKTVRFAKGLSRLLNEENAVLVEVGPGQNLSAFVRKHADKKTGHLIVNLIKHPHEEARDDRYLLKQVGCLWLYDQPVDWQSFYSSGKPNRIPLPPYPFEGKRYWKLAGKTLKNKLSQEQLNKVRKIEGISDWFYRPYWKQQGLSPFAGGTVDKETGEEMLWVVFMDGCGLGSQLVQLLEKQGQSVVCVKRGSAFAKEKQDHHSGVYIINPQEPGHYKRLFKEFSQGEQKPQRVLHLWSVTGNDDGDEDFNYRHFYQLLWLAQALDGEHFSHSLQLTVVSDRMQEVTGQENQQPHKALLLGPIKVIPQEQANIKCRSIDILLPGPGTREEQELLELLMKEFTAGTPETITAYRNNLRWVRGYEPVKLGEDVKERLPAKIKEKSVWLITGGLGNIGMAVARHLAASFQARLILTGRREFPGEDQWQEWLTNHDEADPVSRKIQQLLEMKAMGAEILWCRADAADQEQVQQVLDRAEKRFGHINGVIHTAGIVDQSTLLFVRHMDKKTCERQFRPKVDGLEVLEKVLENRQLDICLLTSSLSSVLGGLGYVSYAAANIFMDAFVDRHNRTTSQRWVSVNLDGWQAENPGPGTMTHEQGIEVLRRIMAWEDVNRVVVSITHLQDRIDQWIHLQSPGDEEKTGKLEPLEPGLRRQRPQLSTPYVEPETPMEQKLAAVWQDFFSIDKVGILDNFFDLGASSLDLVQLSVKFKEAIGKEVPVVSLFRYPMIGPLAKHLDGDNNADILSKEELGKKRAGEIQKGRQTIQSRLQLIKKDRQ
jgi:acyl transferase domain-containing protein/acyl carrier protein